MVWVSKLRRYLPRRRRRVWRYVSGRRRNISLALLAVLALLSYGYFYLVNDSRVQAEVEKYLSAATGCKVKADSAHFSIFSGIRVKNLRVYIGQGKLPFLQAPTVVLNHNPSGLFFRGRLEPTEIICVNPKLALVEDVNTGRLNTQALFPMPQPPSKPGGPPMALPVIRVREAELGVYDADGDQLVKVGETRLSVVLMPQSDQVIRLEFEEQAQPKPTICGWGTLDTATGKTEMAGWFGLSDFSKTLPRKYRTWYKRYQIASKPRGCEWSMEAHVGATSQSADAAQFERGSVRLTDVSMELPAEEGGLKLSGVRGRLVFDADGIDVRELTGKLPQLGGASFRLQGRYDGYDAASGFKLELTLDKFSLPMLEQDAQGSLASRLAELQKEFNLGGQGSLTATVERVDGKVHVRGNARLADVSLRMPQVPLPITGVSGEIAFDDQRVVFRELAGRYKDARFTIEGSVGWASDFSCDLRIAGKDVPLTDEVFNAVPQQVRNCWEILNAEGSLDFTAHYCHDPAQSPADDVQATIEPKGRASICHKLFPIPLDKLHGQVRINGRKAVLEDIVGRNGDMTCTFKGTVDLDAPDIYEIHLWVENMPLDRQLEKALPEGALGIYRTFALSGKIDVTDGIIQQTNRRPMEVTLPITLKGVSMTPEVFPYRLDDVVGNVLVTPRKATLENLQARHGQSRIKINGSFDLGERLEGMDLAVEAGDLKLDADLRSALPPDLQAQWDDFGPSGLTDLSLSLKMLLPQTVPGSGAGIPPASSGPSSGMGILPMSPRGILPLDPSSQPRSLPASASQSAAGQEAEYRLVLRPQDVKFCHRRLPYPISGMKGTIIAQPGRLTLDKVTAQAGGAKVDMGGEIFTRGGGAALTEVRTGPIPFDKALLDLLPPGFRKQSGLAPGGTVALNLKSLKLGQAARTPTSLPTTRPAATSAPAGGDWAFDGRIELANAAADIGKPVTFSAVVDGQFSGGPDRFRSAADLTVSKFALGGGSSLGGFSARLAKEESSPLMKIGKLSGDICGGRFAGFGEIKFASPIQYGFNVSVEDVNLENLMSLGQTTTQPLGISGKLTGSLQMTATAGDETSPAATGKLHVDEGRLRHVPVMLGLLQPMNLLALPGENAYHTADVEYYLKGQKLTFSEIFFQDAGLNLLGAGNVDLKTGRLDLTFLSGQKVPRLAGLEQVLQKITNEIITIRVTGTVTKPQVRNVPLHSLETVLHELLKSGGQ